MSERDDRDAVPREMPAQLSTATQAAMALRDADRLERAMKEMRLEFEARFRQGSQTMQELRGENQRTRDALDGKVSARHSTVKAEVDASLLEMASKIDSLANEVAPRATTQRLVAWVVGGILAVASPIGSAVWFAARAPAQADVRAIEERLRALELRITVIDARLGARGATP